MKSSLQGRLETKVSLDMDTFPSRYSSSIYGRGIFTILIFFSEGPLHPRNPQIFIHRYLIEELKNKYLFLIEFHCTDGYFQNVLHVYRNSAM